MWFCFSHPYAKMYFSQSHSSLKSQYHFTCFWTILRDSAIAHSTRGSVTVPHHLMNTLSFGYIFKIWLTRKDTAKITDTVPKLQHAWGSAATMPFHYHWPKSKHARNRDPGFGKQEWVRLLFCQKPRPDDLRRPKCATPMGDLLCPLHVLWWTGWIQ